MLLHAPDQSHEPRLLARCIIHKPLQSIPTSPSLPQRLDLKLPCNICNASRSNCSSDGGTDGNVSGCGSFFGIEHKVLSMAGASPATTIPRKGCMRYQPRGRL